MTLTAKSDPAQIRQWVRESRAQQGLPPHATQDQYDRASIIIGHNHGTQSGTNRFASNPREPFPTGSTVTDRNTNEAKERHTAGSPSDHTVRNPSKVDGASGANTTRAG